MTDFLKTSRYNLSAPLNGSGSVLYNSKTGAIIHLKGDDGTHLAEALAEWPARIADTELNETTLSSLKKLGFLISEDSLDELMEVRERYWVARGATPMTLTITTTQDCNLGCFYCYEERTKKSLKNTDIEDILNLVSDQAKSKKLTSLHVDWYGGEPTLNIEFIESCSLALQGLCDKLNVSYHASIISNGTLWPGDAAEFAERHKFRQVQITFDGVESSHSKIRRLRKGYTINEDLTSFEAAFQLVGKLLSVTQVDVRFNVSPFNRNEVSKFIGLVNRSGWLDMLNVCTVQPARVSRYSEKSNEIRKHELSQEEFETVLQEFQAGLSKPEVLKTAWFQDGVSPKSSVCAALANESMVVGAEGLLYRCGLQVGEKHRAIGALPRMPKVRQLNSFSDEAFWEQFDPTELPNCSRCTFLPICWGGCPKKHLEGDTHSLEETSVYYRKNLPKRIAQEAGLEVLDGFEFCENEQFKSPTKTVASTRCRA